tara:strand:+ start:652 stop:1167 length:516 start_codon:yes stop_codon:yes gene_type:complete
MKNELMLKNVTCVFPHVFNPNTQFGPEGKREITLLLHKVNDLKQIQAIKKKITTLSSATKNALTADTICLKDGDLSGRSEQFGYYAIKATSKAEVPIVNGLKKPITMFDQEIKGGDFVSCIIGLWLQDNTYGTRVNCNLLALQWLKKGDSNADALVNSFELCDSNDDDDEF